LYYTVSGIITPIGVMIPETRDQRLSQSVHGTATYRCDVTRACIMQFALLTMSKYARNM